MSRFDTVDLSSVPAPAVIETISFDALQADFVAAFVQFAAEAGMVYDVGGLETDPVVITGEAFSGRRMLDRARVNDAARAVMLPFAVGTDLDNLAALYKVKRQVVTPATDDTAAVMETDERLRERVQLAPEALTTCGTPGGYRFHALTAEATVTDVGLIVPQPGQVDVVVMAGANGEASPEVVETVRDYLSRDDIKPLTVALTVRAATIVPYDVTAVLEVVRGPDPTLIKNNAEASLRSHAAARFKVGRRFPISDLYAALHVPGVEKVRLTVPTTEVVPGADGVGRLRTVTLTTETV